MFIKSLFLRYSLFSVALFICALGIALITNAKLGTSPITSVPYVLSFICPLSLGALTFITNIFFIVLQIILLKKKFPLRYLLQIPAVLIFSVFIDLCMKLTSPLATDVYMVQLGMCIAGSAVLGLGVCLEITANATVLPGEGLLVVIAYKFNKIFGKIKVLLDVSMVLLAVILSLAFLYSVVGLREGTVISALLVGNFVRLFSRLTVGLQRFMATPPPKGKA